MNSKKETQTLATKIFNVIVKTLYYGFIVIMLSIFGVFVFFFVRNSIWPKKPSINRYGFINKAGEKVIPAQYSDARQFKNGLAAVRDTTERWGFIDTSGTLIIDHQYYKVGDFNQRGYTWAVESKDSTGTEGFINQKGEWVWEEPLMMDYIETARNYDNDIDRPGYFDYVYEEFGSVRWIPIYLEYLYEDQELPRLLKSEYYCWSLINDFGEVLIDGRPVLRGDSLHFIGFPEPISEGKVFARYYAVSPPSSTTRKSKSVIKYCILYDTLGKRVTTKRYQDALPFSEGKAAVKAYGSKYYHYIDTTCKEVIPTKLEDGYIMDAKPFSDGRAIVLLSNETANYILPSGRPIISVEGAQDLKRYNSFSDEMLVLAGVLAGPKKSIAYNLENDVVYEKEDQWVHSYSDGLALFSVSNKGYGYLDKEGQIVIEPNFHHRYRPSRSYFKEGRAVFREKIEVAK